MPDTGPQLGTADAAGTIRRCRHRHLDWRTLSRHVAADFPGVKPGDLARELLAAKQVVEMASLREDTLLIAELLVRHRLLLSTGEMKYFAKLDPQRQPPRKRPRLPLEAFVGAATA